VELHGLPNGPAGGLQAQVKLTGRRKKKGNRQRSNQAESARFIADASAMRSRRLKSGSAGDVDAVRAPAASQSR
jgi:hypothetical protein